MRDVVGRNEVTDLVKCKPKVKLREGGREGYGLGYGRVRAKVSPGLGISQA